MKIPKMMPGLPIHEWRRTHNSVDVFNRLFDSREIELINYGKESFVIAFKKRPNLVFAYENPLYFKDEKQHFRELLTDKEFNNILYIHKFLRILFPDLFPRIYKVFGTNKPEKPFEKITRFLNKATGNKYMYGSIRERIPPVVDPTTLNEEQRAEFDNKLLKFSKLLNSMRLNSLSFHIGEEGHNWKLTGQGYKFVDMVGTYHKESMYDIFQELKDNRSNILNTMREIGFSKLKIDMMSRYIDAIEI